MKAVRWIGSAAVLLIIVMGLVPTILSTSGGKNWLLKRLSQKMANTVTIEKLSLSWFGGQEIEKLAVINTKGEKLLIAPKVATDASLFAILFQHQLGNLAVEAPQVLIPEKLGNVAFGIKKEFKQAALIAIPELQELIKKISPGFYGHVQIQNGQVEIRAAGQSAVKIDAFSAMVDIPSKTFLEVKAQGTTTQNNITGHFFIDVKGDQLTSPLPNLSGDVELTNFPVSCADRILGLYEPKWQGLLLAALGDAINGSMTLCTASDQCQITLKAKTPQFSAELQTQTTAETLILSNPAAFSLAVTPDLLSRLEKAFPTLPKQLLGNVTTLELKLDQLTAPLKDHRLELEDLSVKGSLLLTPMTLTTSQLVLTQFQANFSSPKLSEAIDFSLAASPSWNKIPANLTASGVIRSPFGKTVDAEFHVEGKAIPLAVVDSFAQWQGKLPLLLGPSLNLALDVTWKEQLQGQIHIETDQLHMGQAAFTWGKGLALQEPLEVIYTLPESGINTLTKGQVSPVKPAPITLAIQTLSIPADFQNVACEVELKIPAIMFDHFYGLQDFQSDPASCRIDVKNSDQINLAISSSVINTSLQASLKGDGKVLALTKQALIDYKLTDAGLAWLFEGSSFRPTLVKPATFTCQIEPFSMDLGDFCNSLKLRGTIQTPTISFSNLAHTKQADLDQLHLQFNWDCSKGDLSGKFSTSFPEKGKIDATVEASQLFIFPTVKMDQTEATISAQINNLSTDLIEMILGQTGKLKPLIGATLNLDLAAHTEPNTQRLVIDAKSDLLQIDMALRADNKGLSLESSKKPAQISLTLTPEGYLILDRYLSKEGSPSSPFQLINPFNSKIVLTHLQLPRKAPTQFSFDWSALQLKGQLNSRAFSFAEAQTGERVDLESLNLMIDKSEPAKPLTFALSSSILSQLKSGNVAKEGHVSLKGNLQNLYDPQGNLDLSHLSAQLNIAIDQLPSLLLDMGCRTVGNANCPFSSIFGETLNATATASWTDWNGPIALSVTSPNTRGSLSGKLNNGTLLLDQSLHVQITLTPEFSAFLLKEVNPLSISSISSKDPITLEIPPENFSLPIYPFVRNKISIGKARLELGQVFARNEGNLSTTLGLLKSQQFSKDRDLKLWFAPLDFHIVEGIVDIERTEILLVETFDIALWGKLNLVNESVDMVLGLTADCLKKAFGIKGVPEDYVLQITLKGPMDNVKINTKTATAKIAALLAWSQKSIAGAVGGGIPGAVLGEFLGRIATLPDSGTKAPPPKHPFPWETNTSGKKKKTSFKKPHSSKKAIKKRDKPVKQIKKIIKQKI